MDFSSDRSYQSINTSSRMLNASGGYMEGGGMKSFKAPGINRSMVANSVTSMNGNLGAGMSMSNGSSRKRNSMIMSGAQSNSFRGPISDASVMSSRINSDASVVSSRVGSMHSNGQDLITSFLYGVNEAIFPQEFRLRTLAEALYKLDHRDKQRHDHEIECGAANIFFQKLAFVVGITHGRPKSSSRKGVATTSEIKSDHEVALICTALEMIHRASDSAIEQSFEEIGRDILPLMVKVIDRAFDPEDLSIRQLHGLPGVSKDKKIAVQKITKVLSAYSLVPSAKIPVAHEKKMISSLSKVIDISGYNRLVAEKMNPGLGSNGVKGSASGTGLLMTEAARFNAIATITNLAFAEGNRMLMMTEPGLILSISAISNSAQNEMARQCAALAIMNLSNGDNNSIPDMTGREFLLDTLVRLMDDERPETRRNAAVAIYNLANSDENSALLARYSDGIILEVLIQIILSHDSVLWNDHARANASETLFNMSCSNNNTTLELMANHPGLLDTLSTILKDGTSFIDISMYCAAVLLRLSEIIFPPSPCHNVLLTSFVKAACWTGTDCIAQALDAQASKPENRQTMILHYGLLNALGRMAELQEGEECFKIRAAAISAIYKLSLETITRPIIAKNERIMMALTKASYSQLGQEYKENDKTEKETLPTAKLVTEALKNLIATL